MSRPTIDETMLQIAVVLSMRGTCMKKQVGCVIVDNKGVILSSGYNGQPRGQVHCSDITPCPAYFDGNLSCQAIHAEQNALMRCPDVDKIYTIYITEEPCMKCKLLIDNTSCKRIVWIGGERIGI